MGKTSELFVIDSIAGEAYVDCKGPYKCRDAVIENCPVVKCVENEACNGAQIINFTDSVLCEGLHACHRTEILAAPAQDEASSQQSVSCIGSGACDVARIVGKIEKVLCTGVKSCRKVTVEGSKLVKCHDGHGQSLACQGFATLETECLYCGKSGCADHINMCRYKIIGEDDDDVDSIRFEKCQPETITGINCPAGLEAELQSELNGKEEIDITSREGGSARRMMRRGFLRA